MVGYITPARNKRIVGRAFQPDSEPCQAGKPDLLPCRGNSSYHQRRHQRPQFPPPPVLFCIQANRLTALSVGAVSASVGLANKSAALADFDRLADLAADTSNLGAIGELFRRLNTRLFLRFEEIQPKKRKINKVAGGVVTFGSSPPPVGLYEGPTRRRASETWRRRDFLKRGAFRGVACGQFPSKRVQSLAS